jgi:hypothetical protein
MSPDHELWRRGRIVLILFLFLIISAISAEAAQFARKSSRRNQEVDVEDALKPQLLNADTNPTLRYPIGSISGWSVRSLSYGWLDVSRDRIHYSVVQPTGKMDEGFDVSTGEISEVRIDQMYLQFHRDKRKFVIFYLPQDHWGSLHSGPGTMAAASRGSLGTGSMYQAIKNFDRVLALVKPPAPPPAAPQPVVSPPPEPKPAAPPAPPAIVLATPSGAGANQVVETDESPLIIRGVAMDSASIPAVSINGSPANMRPQNTQAADFWSDPLTLQPGGNRMEITATNSAHAQAKLVFIVHYTPKAAPANPRALDKQDIISLLQGGVPNARVAEIVKDRGLKFSPGPDDLNDIRAAGGNDDLIQAVQQAAAPPK